jgi:hypothetical protein
MQTEQRTSARTGRVWRFFAGGPTETGVLDDEPLSEPIVDLAAPPSTAGPSDHRIERMEAGMRLLAEALKRVHQDLANAVAEVRTEIARAATADDVAAAASQAVLPLQEAVTRLMESTQSLPLILGAATERLASKVEATRVELEETVIALMSQPQAVANGKGNGTREREIWGSG